MTHDNKRTIVEYGPEQLTGVLCTLVESILCEAIAKRSVATIALSGGTTPRALYQALAAGVVRGEVPWSNVQVFFGDERDVPHDNVESNYRMAQRLLLDHLPIEPENIYPMPADSGDLPAGAAEYEATIRRVVKAGPDGIPSFDLILLGIGSDGHTASIFPGSPTAQEREKLVVAPFVPVLGRSRMTFTFPLINAAKTVLCMVTGDDKADVMAEILGSDAEKSSLPAARIDPAGTLIFAMDSAAAKKSAFAVK